MDLFSSEPLSLDGLFEKPVSPLQDLNLDNPEGAIGFMASSPDTDYENLVSSMSFSLAVPIVGTTTIADPFQVEQEPFGTNLTFLGKKDFQHSVAVSDPVDREQCHAQMTELYNKCVGRLESDPKIFLIFMPTFPDIFADDFTDALFRLVGDVPLFGGMAANDIDNMRSAAFGSMAAYSDRIVLVGLSGNIRPAFGTGCRLTTPSDYFPVVTEAEKNNIRRVDNMTFAEYLQKLGFGPDVTRDFPLSLRTRDRDAPEGEAPGVNAVVKINPEDGSGVLTNVIKPGCSISVGYVDRDDIVASTNDCLDSLKANMEAIAKDGYVFDTVFAVSCITRYYSMLAQNSVEAKLIAEKLPDPDLSRFGYFGFGEICPVRDANGTIRNRHHGQSLVMCAL